MPRPKIRAPIAMARLASWKGTSQDGTKDEACPGASPAMGRGTACPVSGRIGFRRTSPCRRARLYRLPQQSRRANGAAFGNPRRWLPDLRSDSRGHEPRRRDQPVFRFPTFMESSGRLRRSARVVPEHPATSSATSTTLTVDRLPGSGAGRPSEHSSNPLRHRAICRTLLVIRRIRFRRIRRCSGDRGAEPWRTEAPS